MEPITLCGAVIVAVGLWVEFESIIMRVARAISGMMPVMSAPEVQRPLYVKYLTDTGS
ncbi:MAG: hypothetical protein HY888_08685 [Deltaproteobacteria bacterium]|nr:hypothetical protein [Deltaproteobacteria bacterium]